MIVNFLRPGFFATPKRRGVLVILGLATVTFCGAAAGERNDNCKTTAPISARKDKKEDHAVAKPGGQFTIDKETTYVSGPLDKDGYIDYCAALNERLRQGVTPANNANVLIWQALGPHPDGAKMPAKFFEWMGIPAPPEKGEYFIPLARYVKEHVAPGPEEQREEVPRQLDEATQRPWTAKEYPHLKAWLEANDKPLAVVVQATRRWRYFSPLVAKKEKDSLPLLSADLTGVQQCRALGKALAARAMLRTAEGAVDDAYLDAARPSRQRSERCLRDLQELPPVPALVDNAALGERFMFLDAVQMMARSNAKELGAAIFEEEKTAAAFARRAPHGINWDLALRLGNRWWDRITSALREKDRRARQKQFDQLNADEVTFRKKVKDAKYKLAASILGNRRREELDTALGDIIGETIGYILIGMLTPAMDKIEAQVERMQQEHANLCVAFALAAYQREHGQYPNELSALVPRYLQRLPQDLFSGKALTYRPGGDGYLLYSVGINGKDDSGRGFQDQPPGDDLSVRMPLRKVRRE